MSSISTCLISRQSSAADNKVERPLLDSSVLGRFMRKCRLEYNKLDFGGAGQLWDLFKAVREPSSAELPIVSRGKHTDQSPRLHTDNLSATAVGSTTMYSN